MNRRQFLKSAGQVGIFLPIAPAICRANWLMPVKSLLTNFNEEKTEDVWQIRVVGGFIYSDNLSRKLRTALQPTIRFHQL